MALGIPRNEMLSRMSSEELTWWLAFAEIEPFGSLDDFWRTGLITAMIYNTNRDPKKGKPAQPEDFMPIFTREPKQMSPEDQLAYVQALHAAFSGKKQTGKTLTSKDGKIVVNLPNYEDS